jgi:hypothetical protein
MPEGCEFDSRFFSCPDPFSCTMALDWTQPLTEISTENITVGKGRHTRLATSSPIAYKRWEPQRLTNIWASMACCRVSFTFLPIILNLRIAVFWVILQCHNPVCIVSAGRRNDEFQRMWKDRIIATSSCCAGICVAELR